MASTGVMSTPINTITRDNLTVLIANNILNDSVEFADEGEMMVTDSPIRKSQHNLQPIKKKLFHSPHPEKSPILGSISRSSAERSKKARKRKQLLIPDSGEHIKRAYVEEYERDGYSPEPCAGMRKRVLISLFHNKEYSLDVSM